MIYIVFSLLFVAKAGNYTPESSVEHPQAVEQLAQEWDLLSHSQLFWRNWLQHRKKRLILIVLTVTLQHGKKYFFSCCQMFHNVTSHRFARAGGDITQTFTYYSRDVGVPEGCNLTCRQINQVGLRRRHWWYVCLFIKASCDIAFKVARERGTIVAGGIVQTAVFKHVKVVNNNVQQWEQLKSLIDSGQARR